MRGHLERLRIRSELRRKKDPGPPRGESTYEGHLFKSERGSLPSRSRPSEHTCAPAALAEVGVPSKKGLEPRSLERAPPESTSRNERSPSRSLGVPHARALPRLRSFTEACECEFRDFRSRVGTAATRVLGAFYGVDQGGNLG